MEAAETLFLKHGLRRVSVDEVCRSAGVSRKTFYVYFTNKDALTIDLLDKIIGTLTGGFVEIMRSNVPFINKMIQFMELKIAFSRKLSMDFIADLTASDEISQYYWKKANENIDIARLLFEQAQEKGDIRSELDIDFIIYMLNIQMDLCGKEEFRARFKDGESMVKQLSELLLFGIVGSNKG